MAVKHQLKQISAKRGIRGGQDRAGGGQVRARGGHGRAQEGRGGQKEWRAWGGHRRAGYHRMQFVLLLYLMLFSCYIKFDEERK